MLSTNSVIIIDFLQILLIVQFVTKPCKIWKISTTTLTQLAYAWSKLMTQNFLKKLASPNSLQLSTMNMEIPIFTTVKLSLKYFFAATDFNRYGSHAPLKYLVCTMVNGCRGDLTASIFESGSMPTPWKILAGLTMVGLLLEVGRQLFCAHIQI